MRCASALSPAAPAGHDETVIHDADRSLAAWLSDVLPEGVTVTAEPPAPAWAQRPPALSLVDAFLCDIREDGTGLSADSSPVRGADGGLTARQPPVRRYRLSYLLTAWAAEVAAGHELLGAVLTACAADDIIPPGCLRGTLALAGLPVTLRCAPPEPAVTPQQLWASLGIPPRAAVVLVMTVPLVPAPQAGLAPPARRLDLDLTAAAPPGQETAGTAPAGTGPAPDSRAARRWERGKITERHS